MKRFTLTVIGCAMAFGAMAHRDVYFAHEFSKAENLGHDSWSYNGAIHETAETSSVLICTGDFIHNGKTSIEIKHDQRNNGVRVMPNLAEVHLFLNIGTYNANPVPHVTPSVVITDDAGSEISFAFDMLDDDMSKDQTIVSKSMTGDLSTFGSVNKFSIYFDGVEEGEEIAPYSIGITSDWIMPKVSPSRVVDCYTYNRGPGDETRPGTYTTETGMTYIQAEDFDESWINNRTTHTGNGSTNTQRLYKEDQDVNIAYEGQNNFGDGSPYGRWYNNHGHIVGNRWAGNDDLLGSGTFTGGILQDWCPNGQSDMYYKYSGEYMTSNPKDDPYITLENALKKWGIWAEYTFDVEEDCEIDVSLAVAAHRTPYESGIQSNLYWWDDKSQGGYVVDGFDDDPYMKILGFKYTMALDDEIQRTAYESAPIFHNNGITFLNSIKDPRTWENTQDDVNGEKLNSCYLRVFPYPFWGDESNPDSYGTGWYSYYKSDMLDKAAEQGVIPTSVRDAYSHADYMNLPVSKGRHTIKVQNCGGLSWFDEIRIKAHSQSGGVDDISADDLNTTDGIAQYFDLQGRKILNPSNGIYIVKRGNKVTKEVIR